METLQYTRFILVRDNFYDQPELIYRAALEACYYASNHATGYRSREIYHQAGVKQRLEGLLGVSITRWDTDPKKGNGIFYQTFSKGTRREIPGVHSDEPYNDLTVVIYLTPNLPANCGTSLWMHKQTGLMDPAMPSDARRFGIQLKHLRQHLEQESKLRDKWFEICRVGYRFNRMVAYPSGVFHSATRHFGSSIDNGRLYQTFRVGVDWNTLKTDLQVPVKGRPM